MKATIARKQLDIDYKCPNCYLHFRLSNEDIPQATEIKMECSSCRESLTIPCLYKSNIKNKSTPSDPVIRSATLAMQAMGFKISEATSLITKVYYKGISVNNLIKESIKNV